MAGNKIPMEASSGDLGVKKGDKILSKMSNSMPSMGMGHVPHMGNAMSYMSKCKSKSSERMSDDD